MTDNLRSHGLDISKYQNSFMPKENPPRQVDFVVQRSSYALKKDELFDKLLPGVAKVKRRGWYHYYSTGIDVKQQLEFSLNVIKNSGVKFHFSWMDYETAFNNLNANSAKDIVWMTNEMEQRSGLPSYLYTNPAIWNGYLEPFVTGHRSLKFAIAQYFYWPDPQKKNPSLPRNCNRWDFWQYGITGKYYDKENGLDYGSGHISLDKDVYNGTAEELDKVLGIGEEPTTPPTETPDITNELDDIDTLVNEIHELTNDVKTLTGIIRERLA